MLLFSLLPFNNECFTNANMYFEKTHNIELIATQIDPDTENNENVT